MGHQSNICGLASLSSETLSSNPSLVSGGYGDSQILIFDACNGRRLGRLADAPRFTVNLLHVPEWSCRDVFVAGVDGVVGRYDLTIERKIGEYRGRPPCHRTRVYGLSSLVSQKLLVSSCWNRTVSIWCRDDYSCQKSIKLAVSARSCCCAEDKNLILVGLRNGTVQVLDVRRENATVRIVYLRGSRSAVSEIVRIDENRFVCGSYDGTVIIFDPETGRISANAEVSPRFHGVCVVGTNDSVMMRDGSSIEEEEERLGFLLGRFPLLFVQLRIGSLLVSILRCFLSARALDV